MARHHRVIPNGVGERGRHAHKALVDVVAPHVQVKESPFRGCIRGMLGSKVDRSGIGGCIFDGGASWVSTGRGVWYRRRRISFGRMAWVIGSGQCAHGGRHDVARCGAICLCEWHERAEERTDEFVSFNAGRAEPAVSVRRWWWSSRSRNRRRDARRVEQGGTGSVESRRVGGETAEAPNP